MGEFVDNPSKKIIREYWNKPLIKYLHDNLKYKLLYLGLPGPQAMDLMSWIEYVDQIVAFVCRDYPNPSSKGQPDKTVVDLQKKLTELERAKKIKTFVVYDGYMEEVVLRGRDTNGNFFNQGDVVTVYNLDFCNAIATPLTVTDDNGIVRKLYKFETIRRLLEMQRDISSVTRCKKFAMFLTIHSHLSKKEEAEFVSQVVDADVKKYVSALKRSQSAGKDIKILVAYVYQTIKHFFCNSDFTPEFLPVIYYTGSGENQLLHFTFIGTYNKKTNGLSPCYQPSLKYLNQKMLAVEGEHLVPVTFRGFTEGECRPDSVESFKESESYKRFWTIPKS